MFSRHHSHNPESAQPIYNPLNGMHVEFMGPNTIVNNGQLPNTLKIGVTNNNLFHASNPEELVISFDAENELFLYFIVDKKQASAKDHEVNWALTTEDHFKKIEVHFINPAGDDQNTAWKKEDNDAHTFHTIDVPRKFGKPKTEIIEDQKSRNSTLKGWKLTPSHPVHLNPGETLCIQVSNIVSDMPDGITTAFMGVGVQKKERTLDAIGQIVKSPVFVKNQKVGIGTNDPQATLDVKGNAIISSNLEIGTNQTPANLNVNGNTTISSNLEIGTNQTPANLNVNGKTTISSSVEIGSIETPTNLTVNGFLQVNGVMNNALQQSGVVLLKTPQELIPLLPKELQQYANQGIIISNSTEYLKLEAFRSLTRALRSNTNEEIDAMTDLGRVAKDLRLFDLSKWANDQIDRLRQLSQEFESLEIEIIKIGQMSSDLNSIEELMENPKVLSQRMGIK